MSGEAGPLARSFVQMLLRERSGTTTMRTVHHEPVSLAPSLTLPTSVSINTILGLTVSPHVTEGTCI